MTFMIGVIAVAIIAAVVVACVTAVLAGVIAQKNIDEDDI